jgi:hypothetical protein
MELSEDLQPNRDNPLFSSLKDSLAEACKSFVSRDDPLTNAMGKSNNPQPSFDNHLSNESERPATVANEDQDGCEEKF